MWDKLVALIDLGGPTIIVLLGLSVLGLSIVLFKLIQLAGTGPGHFRALHQALDNNNPDEAAAMPPFGAAVALARENRDPGEMEARLVRTGTEWLNHYALLLRPLELIGYLAPLLGLLGTVLGMIEAFRGLEAQGMAADSGVLAGGIWEALLTTAVGLSVAIPFTAAHALLEARVDGMRERLEDLFARLVAEFKP